MSIYGNFAGLYDTFMSNVPSKKWADYVEAVWEKHEFKPRLVLDLACGTGGVTVRLAKKGYDMTGIDISHEMLMEARRKSSRQKQDILFLNQDMREFELYGSVDAIICLCDSVNYVLEHCELQSVFDLAYYYMNPGGLFLFDINTEYKFANILKNNNFSAANNNCAYIWQNHYDKKQRINEYFVTFFVKEKGTELYERFEECHYERAYEADELEEMLKNSNFNLLGKYGGFSFDSPKKTTERIFFVAQK